MNKVYEVLESQKYIVTIPSKGIYVAELDTDRIRPKKLTKLKEALHQLVDEAKAIQLAKDDLMQLVEDKYEEEVKNEGLWTSC